MTPILAAALICLSPQVHDGDTLHCAGQTVRLFGVNAPEVPPKPLEPGGYLARDRLAALTRNRQVVCLPAPQQHDRYGRTVAVCSVGTVDLGETLLREGLACEWVRYSHHAYRGIGRECDARGK